LARIYIQTGDESVLEEAGDVGRLIAVTRLPVESILDLHSRILCEEIARDGAPPPTQVVEAAVTCLAAVLVAWRVAAEGTVLASEPHRPPGVEAEPPVFLRFEADETLSRIGWPEGAGSGADLPAWARAGDLRHLVAGLSGVCRMSDLHQAIRHRRLSSFDMPRPPPDQIRLRLVICPFRDGSGIIAIHDVTAQLAARAGEIQRRKLESLGQFAGGVAHEINNLLQPIVTIAQLTLEERTDDPELHADLDIVLGCALKAAGILRDVLVFARQAPSPLRPLPLAAAVREALAPVQGCLPPGITLVEDLDRCGDEAAALNPAELEQVVGNLLRNAADAMDERGTITVAAAPHLVSGADAVRIGLPSGRYLRLSVADQGPGIDPVVVHRIFDPFFTTKDIGKGTGLGLSIVTAIIKSWGGCVTLRPGASQGAVFDVFLPPVKPREGTTVPRSGPPAPSVGRRRKT